MNDSNSLDYVERASKPFILNSRNFSKSKFWNVEFLESECRRRRVGIGNAELRLKVEDHLPK